MDINERLTGSLNRRERMLERLAQMHQRLQERNQELIQQNERLNQRMAELVQRENNLNNPAINNRINGNQEMREALRTYLTRYHRYHKQNPTDGA